MIRTLPWKHRGRTKIFPDEFQVNYSDSGGVGLKKKTTYFDFYLFNITKETGYIYTK